MINVTFLKKINISNLNFYIYKIYFLFLFSLEREYKLIIRFYYYYDLKSVKKFILLNLSFLFYIIKSYFYYNLSQLYLTQEDSIDLIKFINKFNSFFCVILIFFAIYLIKFKINNYILKNWKIVKVNITKFQCKLFLNLYKIKKKLGWFNKKKINFISNKLNVSKKDIIKIKFILFKKDIKIDIFKNNNIKNNNFFYWEVINDKYFNIVNILEKEDFKKYILNKLNFSLNLLDNRSKFIIFFRWLNKNRNKKIILKKLVKYYYISTKRIHQIEKNEILKNLN